MKIFAITWMGLLLTGCQLQNTGPLITSSSMQTTSISDATDALSGRDLEYWLSEINRLQALSEAQAQAALPPSFNAKTESPEQLFRYALLNQQLKDRQGWIRARDSLELLSGNTDLSVSMLSLVRLLQFHNQSMINAEARQSRLQGAMQEQDRIQQRQAEELLQSQAQVIELSNKIEALTNLEKSLSIRRALTTDTPQGSANE